MGPSGFSLVVANAVAKGHYDTALARYPEFAKLVGDFHSSDDEQRFQQLVELGVPIITHLALSLELQLKILHFQHSGVYPRGHDISKLGSEFPPETLQVLRSEYLRLNSDPNAPSFYAFAITAGPKDAKPDADWPGEATSYDEALIKVGRAYEKWRYIYEEFGDTLNISFGFKVLVVLVKAVNYAVGHHPGNTRITLRSGTPASEA